MIKIVKLQLGISVLLCTFWPFISELFPKHSSDTALTFHDFYKLAYFLFVNLTYLKF